MRNRTTRQIQFFSLVFNAPGVAGYLKKLPQVQSAVRSDCLSRADKSRMVVYAGLPYNPGFHNTAAFKF